MRAGPGSVPPKLPTEILEPLGSPAAFGGSMANDCSSRPEAGGSAKYKPIVLLSETAFCS